MREKLVKKGLSWALFGMTLVYLFTGLGITQFRIIEDLTFGLVSKNLSFRLHDALLVPFVVLLSVHVFFRPIRRAYLTIMRKSSSRDDKQVINVSENH
jgi:hypothetical protein